MPGPAPQNHRLLPLLAATVLAGCAAAPNGRDPKARLVLPAACVTGGCTEDVLGDGVDRGPVAWFLSPAAKAQRRMILAVLLLNDGGWDPARRARLASRPPSLALSPWPDLPAPTWSLRPVREEVSLGGKPCRVFEETLSMPPAVHLVDRRKGCLGEDGRWSLSSATLSL